MSVSTEIEDRFAADLDRHGIKYVRQARLIRRRQWRWDFAIPKARVAIEIQGLMIMRDPVSGELITRGGHATPQGMRNDMEKAHAILLVGWLPLAFERTHVRNGYAARTVVRLINRWVWPE